MKQLDTANLNELLKKPGQIRNICIVAHVDHGKTTLADSLVASNGIISPRMAGKLRYMDSRKDEQERGITMKSSSITLNHIYCGKEYLVNLIDTPGHVDFSSEVSTAIRLCDGALVVVDVVEGVCPQTQVALKQAWNENIKPTLILNKIDRLILEMKLTPLDAYIHLTQVLEQVNAIVGELFNKDVLDKTEKEVENCEKEELERDWDGALENIDDSSLYFSPDHNNVIFASAIDGWGFSLEDFITLYSKKLGVKETVLRKTLWGDYYYNSKTKSVKKGAQIRAKKPLFVQLVLENIWAIYDTICVSKDKEKIVKMAETLGVKVSTRDMRHTDPKIQLQAICNQWLPISKCVMDMVCKVLPAANQLEDEKVEKLMRSNNANFDKYPEETKQLKTAFVDCSPNENAPLIVFVSKMFAVEPKLLPQNRPQALTQEEMAKRRELAKLRLAQKQEGIQLPEEQTPSLEEDKSLPPPPPPDDVFIAFARVYSGTLKKGSKVYVLGPKHDPVKACQCREEEGDLSEGLVLKDLKAGQHVTKATIGELYLMMGRDLESIDAAYPGNVIGIEGLGNHILKSATLSSELCCPSFSELNLMAVPILRVAIEPVKPTDLPMLIKGLKLLNQADSCVQVIMQETGEHVLVTAGEVHLEHCLHDLKTRYAKVEVMVSEPIIPFRETVVPPPIMDQANEAILQKQTIKKTSNLEAPDETEIAAVWTANKQSLIRIQCLPLPQKITDLLEKSGELLKTLDESTSGKSFCLDSFSAQSESVEGDSKEISVENKTIIELIKLRNDLKEALKDCEGFWKDSNVIDKIWSFGPRRFGPNLLINNIKNYEGRNVWKHTNDVKSPLLEYDSSFVNGFQLATLAGPLCEEPMMGVAFIVIDWEIVENSTSSTTFGPLSGQIMSTVKEACRKSFQLQPQRLMAAMYTCNIQVNSEMLGKMYAVLGRRMGRILHGDMTQGTSTFAVQAVLPVIESFNFAQEIRKQTSGLANPQLVFSHWEVIDIDPFWLPSTEEEYLLFGEKADTENKGRHYMNHVRRRKGLPVDEQIVQHAEKQRTLSRKK